ncbi:MAG TPA: AmmeMemoRadiSam system protein B [Planctomycetota bacterium]|nr:AmmeMemoRadiSam system protein B [Planctomycetota bacterium]
MAGTVYMRYPRVAGTFYPKDPREMRALLDRCYAEAPKARLPLERAKALGAVIPHAGWVYSGGVAAKVYARLVVPASVLILCPNHTGLGARLSAWPGGSWLIPDGEVKVDEELTNLLAEECPELEMDTLAHMAEHAVEVHLPFLVRERPDVRFAALVVGTHDARRLKALAEGISRALGKLGREVLIVASSDLNHYEDQQKTLAKDRAAIDRIVARDPFGLLETCDTRQISMCGVAPTTAMLHACAQRGAAEAVLVDHRTSGDVSGDFDRVVGYAGVIVR